MMGGGVGIHVGIRGADEKSVGVMPHLKTYDACTLAYKQGSRRGSYAMYLDISHPDIVQFLEMRKPTGDQNLRTLNLHHAVNIPDKFMQIIERCMIDETANDDWELIQPNTGKVQEVVSAKALWMKLLELRMQTGEPYIWFIDRANEGVPEYQKAIGLKNHGSNLCSEISLVTSSERTAVCCLSSVNLEYFDEWKPNELFLADILEMLDNVLTYFIANAPDEISRARFSAKRERSVGVGALGFHAYLQQRNIAFEGVIKSSITYGQN
jgi:ribonucleoside-diphosphate reductase alpha chain